MNKQALYYHFGNKEELYTATLKDGYATIRSIRMDARRSRSGPADKAMRAFVETFFDSVVKFRDLVDVVADENRAQGRHLKDAVDH